MTAHDFHVAADFLEEEGFPQEVVAVLRSKAEEIGLRNLGGDVAATLQREQRTELRGLNDDLFFRLRRWYTSPTFAQEIVREVDRQFPDKRRMTYTSAAAAAVADMLDPPAKGQSR